MSTGIAFPFRRIHDDLVIANEWLLVHKNGEWLSVENGIQGWDYDYEVTLTREVEINVDECLACVGLSEKGSLLNVAVIIDTGPSGYKWVVYQSENLSTGIWKEEIKVQVNSEKLARRLTLKMVIILSSMEKETNKFTPDRIGSRLWEDSNSIDLEGENGRFPMEAVNFLKDLPYLNSPNAHWHLDWSPELPDASFAGNVTLYINSSKENFTNLLLESDPVIMTYVRCDIIRQMCIGLLDEKDFIENYGDHPDGSVGSVVEKWLEVAFQGLDVKVVKSISDESLPKFETIIQSTFGGEDAPALVSQNK